MPEFEIYPSNLRRHKTHKQTKVTEQNSPMFALKFDFLAFSSIRKTLTQAWNANKSRNILKVSIVSYKSRGPAVISYWSKNESCALYRSYPGQLRSFKRTGYLEVRGEKSRFILATNLGWRSAKAIIITIIIMLSMKGPILTSLTCIFLRRWPTDIMTTQWQPFFFFSWQIFCMLFHDISGPPS